MSTPNEALNEELISASRHRSVGRYRGTKRMYENTDDAGTLKDKKRRLNPGAPNRYATTVISQRHCNHQQPVDNHPEVPRGVSALTDARGSKGYVAVQNESPQPSGRLCPPTTVTDPIVHFLFHAKSSAAPQGGHNLRQFRSSSALGGTLPHSMTSQFTVAIRGPTPRGTVGTKSGQGLVGVIHHGSGIKAEPRLAARLFAKLKNFFRLS